MIQATTSQDMRSYLDLLLAWTVRTIRARYQQSLLGVIWAIAQPVAMVLIFSIVFTRLVPIDTGEVPYVLFSIAAMVPWTFFAASLADMVNSLVDNKALVSKIYFPREVLPLAAMLARLLDFGIAAGVMVVLMVYFQAPLFPAGWLLLPAILLIQCALALGLGLAFSAFNVFFRDVKHLVELAMRILIYASPIIYPVTLVPEHLRPVYFLNPMSGIITAYRDVLLYGTMPGYYLLMAAVISVILLVGGYWLFKRVEPHFADVV